MTDNELLEQLFQPMKEMQVPDDGFTKRVTQQLPKRDTKKLSRLWTAFCIVAAIVLFVLMRGWETVGFALQTLSNDLPTQQQVLLFMVSVATVGIVIASELLFSDKRGLRYVFD